MIEFRSLTKVYPGGVVGVEELTLTVEPGSLFCLLGPNGSGKTTTISLLFGFFPPTRGSARICGRDVASAPIESRRLAAYVPESVSVYGNLTARQNVVLFAELSGVSGDLARAAERALERAGLASKDWRRRLREFSKGMRQKVGLAIALVRDCPVIVLDEPTSGLDPVAAEELMNTLRSLRDEGRTILMSTHDIFRVEQVADRVGILKAGRLVKVLDAPFLRDTDLVRLYLEAIGGCTSAPGGAGPAPTVLAARRDPAVFWQVPREPEATRASGTVVMSRPGK